MGNRATRNPLRNKEALRLWNSVLADCLVMDPARLRWIFETYPESDCGRPLLFAPPTACRKKKRKDAPDAGRPGNGSEREEMEMAA